ncbi:hypothetical protein FQN49_003110 [Arthroderma sp. PD_2]|nr:hypothetical protein FQN49_003110 [Arthroderma sp. PD_2]
MTSTKVQSETNIVSSLSRHLPMSPTDHPARSDTEAPAGQEMDLESSVFISNFILILALTIYFLLALCIVWRYGLITAIKEWVSSACYRGQGYRETTRHNRQRAMDMESAEDSYILEELDLSDGEEGEGVQLLRVSRDPTLPNTAIDGPQQQGRETKTASSRNSSRTHNHSDGITSLGISKYFDPETERLRDDILSPTQTALDGMCAVPEDEVHGSGPWYRPIERASDRLIMRAQAWLDDEQSDEDKKRQQKSRELCDGERNRAVRQILLARQREENDGNGEGDLY